MGCRSNSMINIDLRSFDIEVRFFQIKRNSRYVEENQALLRIKAADLAQMITSEPTVSSYHRPSHSWKPKITLRKYQSISKNIYGNIASLNLYVQSELLVQLHLALTLVCTPQLFCEFLEPRFHNYRIYSLQLLSYLRITKI